MRDKMKWAFFSLNCWTVFRLLDEPFTSIRLYPIVAISCQRIYYTSQMECVSICREQSKKIAIRTIRWLIFSQCFYLTWLDDSMLILVFRLCCSYLYIYTKLYKAKIFVLCEIWMLHSLSNNNDDKLCCDSSKSWNIFRLFLLRMFKIAFKILLSRSLISSISNQNS